MYSPQPHLVLYRNWMPTLDKTVYTCGFYTGFDKPEIVFYPPGMHLLGAMNIPSDIPKLHVKFGLNPSINVVSIHVLTDRKRVLTPRVIQNNGPSSNLHIVITKLNAKLGLNRSIYVAFHPSETGFGPGVLTPGVI
jgi:hypothetical protein